MWARAGTTLLWLSLAAWGVGCSYMPLAMLDRQAEAPSGAVPTAEPKTTPPDARELEDAVQLILDLRYKEGAGRLLHLLPRLEAAGDQEGAGEAVFWLGYCDEKQGRLVEAGERYTKVVQEYSETAAARLARQRLAELRPGGE